MECVSYFDQCISFTCHMKEMRSIAKIESILSQSETKYCNCNSLLIGSPNKASS